MTRQEFIAQYLRGSAIPEDCRTPNGFRVDGNEQIAIPCDCGVQVCEGWQMVGPAEALEALGQMLEQPDRSEAADAARFRWLLNGAGYFMEEHCLCGHAETSSPEEQDEARRQLDAARNRGIDRG